MSLSSRPTRLSPLPRPQMHHGRRDGSWFVSIFNFTHLFRPLTSSSRCPCLLAGKTLQCIALLHVLLLQSPIAGRSTMEKGIIVCPSSLVKNWGNELGESLLFSSRLFLAFTDLFVARFAVKWLGPGVITPLSVDGKGGREELIPAVRRWVAAKGRNVTQQGSCGFSSCFLPSCFRSRVEN